MNAFKYLEERDLINMWLSYRELMSKYQLYQVEQAIIFKRSYNTKTDSLDVVSDEDADLQDYIFERANEIDDNYDQFEEAIETSFSAGFFDYSLDENVTLFNNFKDKKDDVELDRWGA